MTMVSDNSIEFFIEGVFEVLFSKEIGCCLLLYIIVYMKQVPHKSVLDKLLERCHGTCIALLHGPPMGV